jgi:hypothetical protein
MNYGMSQVRLRYFRALSASRTEAGLQPNRRPCAPVEVSGNKADRPGEGDPTRHELHCWHASTGPLPKAAPRLAPLPKAARAGNPAATNTHVRAGRRAASDRAPVAARLRGRPHSRPSSAIGAKTSPERLSRESRPNTARRTDCQRRGTGRPSRCKAGSLASGAFSCPGTVVSAIRARSGRSGLGASSRRAVSLQAPSASPDGRTLAIPRRRPFASSVA